jgi:hypothetical protein
MPCSVREPLRACRKKQERHPHAVRGGYEMSWKDEKGKACYRITNDARILKE